MENNNTKDMNNNITYWIIAILLLIINSFVTYFIVDEKTSGVAEKVVAKMLAIEYDKVWWMENYVKINKISKEQIILWLKQYDQQNNWNINWWQANSKINNQQPSPSKWNQVTIEQANSIISDWTYIMWNKDAEISFIEYSDLECPFCKKLHEAGTIEKILKEYDWKVNFIFKQYPLSFHANAPMEAEAALCVWSLNWSDKYYEFIEEVFKNSKTNWTSYTSNSISDLWSTIWIDKKELLSCINSWKFKQSVQKEINEWSKIFGVTWTPGNVMINKNTWKWEKLPWAYPYESFKEKIDLLLK